METYRSEKLFHELLEKNKPHSLLFSQFKPLAKMHEIRWNELNCTDSNWIDISELIKQCIRKMSSLHQAMLELQMRINEFHCNAVLKAPLEPPKNMIGRQDEQHWTAKQMHLEIVGRWWLWWFSSDLCVDICVAHLEPGKGWKRWVEQTLIFKRLGRLI